MSSARRIRESEAGAADRQVVNVMPSVAGGNGLEWPQPVNGVSAVISTMSSPFQTAEQANLWMGIRSELCPHELSSRHPN
jgi:hypothetical protein